MEEIGLSTTEYIIVYVLYKIVSSISFILNILSIMTYLLFKKKFPNNLIIYITISSLMINICILSQPYRKNIEELCIFQGTFLNFFALSFICWYFVINLNL